MRGHHSRIGAVVLTTLVSASAGAQTITTVAGGGPTGPVDARLANLRAATDTAVDASGNLYIAADTRVFRVAPDGTLTVAAGSGAYSGIVDGAVSPDFFSASGIDVDPAGNLYIADSSHNRVLKQDAATGVLRIIAGNGLPSYFEATRDGGLATSTTLWNPTDVTVDGAGNVFITDSSNNRIRRVDGATQVITTVAGDGSAAGLGDGLEAIYAQLFWPNSTAVDGAGNLYVADSQHNRVRKVTAATGRISTVAGNGSAGYTGDGGLAINARISVARVALDGAGNLLIADTASQRIRRVDASTGIIRTVAGSGIPGFGGDGGSALDAQFNRPYGVTLDAAGNIYVPDAANFRVRRIDAATGRVSTFAGNGSCCISGDGGLAVRAATDYVADTAVDSAGNLYLTNENSHRVRKVERATGVITTIAGTGEGGYTGDGGPATAAKILTPYGIAVDRDGNVYFTEHYGHRIRRVDGVTGVITTVAGTGTYGTGGDGGPATAAEFEFPEDLAFDAAGRLYGADNSNRIRRVDPTNGVIVTVAGSGAAGYSGDGGPATAARFYWTTAVTVAGGGDVYVVDRYNNRVRKVDAVTGHVTTIAGTGVAGYSGDGGAATGAALDDPTGVAVDPAGNVFIADSLNGRVRRVDAASGLISTVVGTGELGSGGDGGPALQALIWPMDLALDAAGALYVTDEAGRRIRRVTGLVQPPDDTPPVIAPAIDGTLGTNGWYTSSVSVAWSVSDPESPVGSTDGCGAQNVTGDTAGTAYTCTATSAGGVASRTVTLTRDAAPPRIALAAPADGATYLLRAAPTASFECTDATSGIARCQGSVPDGAALDTSTVGSHSFTVDAADKAGNPATVTRTYRVQFQFAGFAAPIDNPPIINSVAAGRTIPVKWRLLDGTGTRVADLSSFKSLSSAAAPCSSGATDEVGEAATTNAVGLRYDAVAQQFVYTWTTSSAWKNSCRKLVLELSDGQTAAAVFLFR